MSDCPYTFVLHPDFSYHPIHMKDGYATMQYISYDKLIELYGLDPENCTPWQRIVGQIPERPLIHLRPVINGDYTGTLIRAILRYEADEEYVKKVQEVLMKTIPLPPPPSR